MATTLLRDPSQRAETRRVFRSEARYLIVEALVDCGVVLSPLVKYIDYNIRVCRPVGLTREQIQKVLDYVISRVGFTYDQRNVRDLLRYLLSFHLVPARLRVEALHFGSGKETETICSSLLAEAFAKIGFPIMPVHIRRRALRRGWRAFFARPRGPEPADPPRMRHPTLRPPGLRPVSLFRHRKVQQARTDPVRPPPRGLRLRLSHLKEDVMPEDSFPVPAEEGSIVVGEPRPGSRRRSSPCGIA